MAGIYKVVTAIYTIERLEKQAKTHQEVSPIQKCVTFYVNRMLKDKLINDKTKQYLIQLTVNQDDFT